jgi:hypothetical protein
MLAGTIFDKIRRGERDTGQVSTLGRVMQFEKTRPFRDLRQKPTWVPPGRARALLAHHSDFAFPGFDRIM